MTSDRAAAAASPWGRLALAAALLPLLAQLLLYVLMAGRGFDFSDESFYFLSYLHWRDFAANISFFGAFFEWPFRALGQSVAAMRLLSVLLLLGSAWQLARAALAHAGRLRGLAPDPAWPLVLSSMAAALLYFSFLASLRAPSYNLLALCAMMLATGLLLRILDAAAAAAAAAAGRSSGAAGRAQAARLLAYGFSLAVCGLAKGSSGALLMLGHLAYFAARHRDWGWRTLPGLLAWSLLGLGLCFAGLQWAHSGWLASLREGLAVSQMRGGYGLMGLLKGLRWDLQRVLPLMLAPAAVVLALAWWLPRRALGRARLQSQALWAPGLVLLLVLACALSLMMARQALLWLPVLALAVLALGLLLQPAQAERPGRASLVPLLLLLLSLPLVLSFGTNMSVLAHSQTAAVFAVLALCLQLQAWASGQPAQARGLRGLVQSSCLPVCLFLLGLPPLFYQAKAWTDAAYTYRQTSGLGRQNAPLALGPRGDVLLLDEAARDSLRQLITAARSAGLPPGQTVLDFTGDGAGLIYALAARPLGTAWAGGGYAGSEDAAARLLSGLDEDALRGSWLLASTDNPRRIQGWQQLLATRLGPDSHQLAGTVSYLAPYRWGPQSPPVISVQFWRPRVARLKSD